MEVVERGLSIVFHLPLLRRAADRILPDRFHRLFCDGESRLDEVPKYLREVLPALDFGEYRRARQAAVK